MIAISDLTVIVFIAIAGQPIKYGVTWGYMGLHVSPSLESGSMHVALLASWQLPQQGKCVVNDDEFRVTQMTAATEKCDNCEVHYCP